MEALPLPLESDEWSRLRHAYGPAVDIPPLLRQLAKSTGQRGGRDEPWHSLFSALCHQGDAYTASYAAVPHIVQIGLTATGPIDMGFFHLPACIEIARVTGRAPDVPPGLQRAYFGGLESLHECAFRHRDDSWDSDMAQCVAGALAAAKGQHRLAEAIINLDRDIIQKIIEQDW